jgi:hypothetical protein
VFRKKSKKYQFNQGSAFVWLVGSVACSRFGCAGREQASIQHRRAIQAGLKFNFGHLVPQLTFSDLVALPLFLGFHLF